MQRIRAGYGQTRAHAIPRWLKLHGQTLMASRRGISARIRAIDSHERSPSATSATFRPPNRHNGPPAQLLPIRVRLGRRGRAGPRRPGRLGRSSATDLRFPRSAAARRPISGSRATQPSRSCAAPGTSRRRRRATYRLLDAPRRPTHTPPTSRRAGCERDEYPSCVDRETRWLVETGATAARNGPGSLRTERQARSGDARAPPSRLRRRAPAIQGSADRHGPGTDRTPGPSVTRVRHRRMRVAPRKARPFVPGTIGRS